MRCFLSLVMVIAKGLRRCSSYNSISIATCDTVTVFHSLSLASGAVYLISISAL
ncbi:hypothetical protein BaRGS_00004454, partial [Batillaria attramentaria]